MKIPTNDEMKQINKEANELENRLGQLLTQSLGYDQAISLLLTPSVSNLALRNQRIFILFILANVVKREIEAGEKHLLFDGRSVDDLIVLYQKLVLYFRRIEFDLPEEHFHEISEFVISENISATALFGIIDGANILIHKEKIRTGIIKIISTYAV